MHHAHLDPERARLHSARDLLTISREAGAEHTEQLVPWHRWGPYLAERQWGTVREDYSSRGAAWEYFPFEHAASRAYRWGEDGLLGICDDQMRLCFAIALWNGADAILKERLFGLAGPQGNHGEDVKEYYYFLDATPTHSYLRALYKYPQRAFPYDDLRAENQRRDRHVPEYELADTGIFADNRYFDVHVEYAKVDPTDIVIRLTVTNRGPDRADLHLLPTLWFRNTWSWGLHDRRPQLRQIAPDCIEASWRVYDAERRLTGRADRAFLESVFQKLLLNFTWWVNRKDPEGLNVFQGGFLGLDNIGVIDRSKELPDGGQLEQSDGTAWMGMYSLNMLVIALELARENHVYEEVANKFFQHFLYVAGAMNNVAGRGFSLWNEEDEFFYDILSQPRRDPQVMRVRSLVGLIPLLAVETIEPDVLAALPRFRARLEWFLTNRPALASLVSRWHEPGVGERRLLALVRGHRMKRLLKRMLDPDEFLGEYGVRSVSKYHASHPFMCEIDGQRHEVGYEPAESMTSIFGGNSNWRGPIWFPINFLLIESLRKFHHYYGDDFLVECPTGSGAFLTLEQIATELSQRLIRLFVPTADGVRPALGPHSPLHGDNLLFHEYFHADTGQGLGASHQTGWTALVANLLAEKPARP